MKISKRERKAAIKWCNMRACWWFNATPGEDFSIGESKRVWDAFEQFMGSKFFMGSRLGVIWLEAEALLRDGWSPK